MRRAAVAVGSFFFFGVGLARADEIIYLANGSAMRAMSHEVRGATIRVVVGPNASISFPAHLVERIERSGVRVYPDLGPAAANRVASSQGASVGAGEGTRHEVAYPVDGRANVPARFRSRSSRRSQWMDPLDQLKQAEEGTAIGPGTPAPGPAGRFMRTMAPRPGEQNTGPVGAHQVGSRHVLDGSPDPRSRSRTGPIVSIQPLLPTAPAGSGSPASGGSSQQGSSNEAGPADSQAPDAPADSPDDSE